MASSKTINMSPEKTLILAERAGHSLRSRIILQRASNRYGSAFVWDVKKAVDSLEREDEIYSSDEETAKVIVLAGVFRELAILEMAMLLAQRKIDMGGRIFISDFALEEGCLGRIPKAALTVFEDAGIIRVRDYISANELMKWNVNADIIIEPYAERDTVPDFSLANDFIEDRVAAISLTNGSVFQNAQSSIRLRLQNFTQGYYGNYIAMACEHSEICMEDNLSATSILSSMRCLPHPLSKNFAEASWRREKLNPANFKGLFGCIDFLITSSDVHAAFAIDQKIPVIGLVLNRNIVTVFSQLSNELHSQSELIYL